MRGENLYIPGHLNKQLQLRNIYKRYLKHHNRLQLIGQNNYLPIHICKYQNYMFHPRRYMLILYHTCKCHYHTYR